MSGEETRKGYLGSQVDRWINIGGRQSVTPPLPEKIGIEINNSCNHKCYFCPNPTMERSRSVMDDAMVMRVTREAFEAGIRQISFYSGGEPFLNKNLAKYVRYAKDLGFSYVYLSSNGGKVVSSRIQAVIDAGLDSIKFSVNAGDRDTYALVHGHDEFDDVIENIEFVARYRQETNKSLRLFVSFVDTPLSHDTFPALKERIGHLVDEVVIYPFVVIGTPLKKRTEKDGTERPFIGYEATDRSEDWNQTRLKLPCYQLWSYLNVTMEGYLSACCSDYNNDLVVGNLHDMSLMDAWHSEEFQEFRRRHIHRDVRGTLCEGCILQRNRPYESINLHLRSHDKGRARIANAQEHAHAPRS
jgi:MoaA/NifB/PqqE/SkfB family radical SAM enzyme